MAQTPDALVVQLKFFSDDFEENLSEWSNKTLIFQDGIKKNEQKVIEAYLKENFILTINGKILEPTAFECGNRESGLVTYIRMAFPFANEKITQINLTHRSMMEAFSNQKNILVLKLDALKEKLEFNKNEPNRHIDLR